MNGVKGIIPLPPEALESPADRIARTGAALAGLVGAQWSAMERNGAQWSAMERNRLVNGLAAW
jgi:hypothetical protein